MVFAIEAVVLCAVFTAIVVPSLLRDPLAWVGDYPPAIGARCRELGLVPRKQEHSAGSLIVSKLGRMAAAVAVLTAAAIFLNGAETFRQGFAVTYGLWTVVAWYDALVLDCLWFCHSRKVVIPGTEDLVSAYRDYGFHLRMSCLGMVLGLPVAALTGLLVAVFR